MSDVATGDEEDVEQKVLIPEFYKKDYSLFREELNKLLELETARLDLARIPSADGERVRIKFKNLLIEHANTTLRTYRKSIAYLSADALAAQKDEAHLLPPNKALKQRNDLLRTLYLKAVDFNAKAQVQQLDFAFQDLKHPEEKLMVERNGQTVPLEEVLPALPLQEYERRLKVELSPRRIFEKWRPICRVYTIPTEKEFSGARSKSARPRAATPRRRPSSAKPPTSMISPSTDPPHSLRPPPKFHPAASPPCRIHFPCLSGGSSSH